MKEFRCKRCGFKWLSKKLYSYWQKKGCPNCRTLGREGIACIAELNFEGTLKAREAGLRIY